MHRTLKLPELFLAISVGLIGIEAMLSGGSLIKAKYGARDTAALLGMQVGVGCARQPSFFAGVQPPLAFLGFPPQMILAQQGFNLFYQFWIHTEAVRRMPAWFEYLFNTPSHHRVHHGSNPLYLDCNYAGVLMVWDRLMGTFVAERDDEPVRYGLVHNIDTFNPIRIAFHEWAAILGGLLASRSWRETLGTLFGPPGWRADGGGRTSKNLRAELNLAADPNREKLVAR